MRHVPHATACVAVRFSPEAPFPGQHRKTSRAILIIVAFVIFCEIYTASVSTVMVPETKAPVGIHVLLALVLWIVSLVM